MEGCSMGATRIHMSTGSDWERNTYIHVIRLRTQPRGFSYALRLAKCRVLGAGGAAEKLAIHERHHLRLNAVPDTFQALAQDRYKQTLLIP